MNCYKKIFACILAIAMAAAAAGCGTEITENAPAPKLSNETTPEEDSISEAPAETTEEVITTTAAPETTAEKKPTETKRDIKYIGEADDAAADYSVELTNGTDKAITKVAVRYNEGEYSDNLLPEGETFESEETRLFNWSNTISGDLITLGEYDLELTFDNEDSFVLHGFPLTDMLTGEIRLMDEYVFIVYTNKIGDNKDNMKEEAEIAEKERIEKQKEEAAKLTETTTTAAPQESQPEVTETEQTEAPAENVW